MSKHAKNRYIYARGAAAGLGVMTSVIFVQALRKGFSFDQLASPRFLFEIAMAFLCSFPFVSYAALRKWQKDHPEPPVIED